MRKTMLAVSVAVASLIGFAGVAGAEPATTSDQVTTMATEAAADLLPIFIGVGGALVAVAVARFGVRWVLSAIGRGGRG